MDKIILFQSEPKQTAFAPSYEYIISEGTINGINFDKIKRIILKKEKEIIKNYEPSSRASEDGYTGLGKDSLTARYEHFNILSWKDAEIQKLKKSILLQYIDFLNKLQINREPTKIQCWANVMRKGQSIKPHLHSFNGWSYLSGHVVVACDETSTIYIDPINQINSPREYSSDNKVGNITFFQQNIPHYTTKHKSDNERITIAFDIFLSRTPSLSSNFISFDDLSINS